MEWKEDLGVPEIGRDSYFGDYEPDRQVRRRQVSFSRRIDVKDKTPVRRRQGSKGRTRARKHQDDANLGQRCLEGWRVRGKSDLMGNRGLKFRCKCGLV